MLMYRNNRFFLVTFCFSVNELLKIKEDLTKERDDLLQEIVKLREGMAEAQGKITQMEAEQEDNHHKLQEVKTFK